MLALIATPLTLRADEDLIRITGTGKIAREKWTKLVTKAISDAQKVEKSDPFKAKDILQDMMRSVKNTSELVDDHRAELVRRLQTPLNRATSVANAREVEIVQKAEIDRPRKQGPKYTPPAGGGSSSVAKDFIGSAKGALDGNRAMVQQRQKNTQGVYLAMEKTPTYPTGDSPIAFPADWATRVAKRATGPVLTEKEKALLKTLNSVMTINYDNDKFRAVLDDLRVKTGLTIIVDEGSLEDAKVEYDDPVTFRGTKLNVRTVLKKVLGDKSLTYIIKEGCIQVMTPKKASEYLVTRSYPIGDLIQPDPRMMGFGPFIQQQMMMQNAYQLINLIQTTIDPTYWQANGGPGSITYFGPSQSIVVRASAEMHYQLGAPGMFGR